jgi:hypothetical protein
MYAAALFVMLLTAPVFSQTDAVKEEQPEALQTPVSISVSISPGEFWKTKMQIFIFSTWKTPQTAVWLEDGDGGYLKTLMVTGSASNKKWKAAPKAGRPEALPVWFFTSGRAEGKDDADVDAVTGATPEGTVTATDDALSLYRGREYAIKLEVNTSFDYNEFWPEKAKKGTPSYSGVNGQPSVVYEARFVAGETATVQFRPVGQGAVDGSSGTIVPGTEGLTTALQILASAQADIR